MMHIQGKYRVKAIFDQKNIFSTKVGFWCSFVSWTRIWVSNWSNRELRVARSAFKIPNPISKTIFTSIKHAEYAYILTQNKIFDLMRQKFFDSAHAKFKNQRYLKMRGRNQNFEWKFELVIKFRVEWYIMIVGLIDTWRSFQWILLFTPTQSWFQ